MSACNHCGAQTADDVRFCSACGTPQGPVWKAETALASPPRPAGSDPSMASAPPGGFAPGQIVADRYRVVSLLGRGGMGDVYRADDLKLGQAVAIKFLPDRFASDEAVLERFRAEVRTSRQIAHPNVCRVYDIGEADGRQFLTMEYVDGEDLASLLRRIGRLPANKALEVARQMCAGLAAIHERGVIHRDLKPANVMLDGYGRVRITDFGLAAAPEEMRPGEISGTPAYMAPEQFEGQPCTVRTDLYALGLILYEAFTGKPTFGGATFAEWRARHTQTIPTAPSQLQANMDAVVERAILRCLEKDPTKRPSSAKAVAASLPGGDPLAAALAGGETPSPEMVAAAGGEGALRPRVAWTLLAATLVLVAACLAVAPDAMDLGLARADKGPEVLEDRARQLTAAFGYRDEPADSEIWFERDYSRLRFMADRVVSTVWRRQMESWGPPLLFNYRQSPRPLVPRDTDGVVQTDDPPQTVSGMVTVTTDARGRLRRFEAAPPQFEEFPSSAPLFAWGQLFSAAGLDMTRFVVSPQEWLSPQPFDARGEWSGPLPWAPDVSVRVSAAAHRGRPVYFEVLGPWSLPARMVDLPLANIRRVTDTIGAAIVAFLIVSGVFFARRNLHAGRGDRRGAFVLAAILFVGGVFKWLIVAHHVSTLADEIGLVFTGVAGGLLLAAAGWLLYVALEPYVRRTMPEVMISWARLADGRVRDARIGRDMLIGSLAGALTALLTHVGNAVPAWLPFPSQTTIASSLPALQGGRRVLVLVLDPIGLALTAALTALALLFLLRLVLRRTWLAAVALVVPLLLTSRWGENIALDAMYFVAFAVLVPFVLVRFGLVATFALVFMRTLLTYTPLPLDPSRWYFGGSLLALAVGAALVVYAFRISLGPRGEFAGADVA